MGVFYACMVADIIGLGGLIAYNINYNKKRKVSED